MLDAPRCLIVGSDGMTGSALLARLRREGIHALGTSRRTPQTTDTIPLDLASDPRSWRIPAATSVVVNCAAVAGAAVCQRSPDESRRVNVDAVVALAQRCASESRMFVQLSSDRVFSGRSPRTRADAPFAPASEYGRQKAEADRRLLEMFAEGGELAIVRFAKLVSRTHALFGAWRDSLCRGEAIRPFADMTMAPVTLDFAIAVLYKVILERRTGVFQASAESDVTYSQFAGDLAEACGAARELVIPISSVSATVDIDPPPPFTSLDVSRVRNEMNLIPPTPKEVAEWIVRRLSPERRNAVSLQRKATH
ncbi:MAG TPA: sugar nucleotide-binding protein [Pirellulales bacterium]|nr:sugar nucleotide-binding protein [Pirellulales bacterium]